MVDVTPGRVLATLAFCALAAFMMSSADGSAMSIVVFTACAGVAAWWMFPKLVRPN